MSSRKKRGRKRGSGQSKAGRSPGLLIGLLLVAVLMAAAWFLLRGEAAEGDSSSPPRGTSTAAPTPAESATTPPAPSTTETGIAGTAPAATGPTPPDVSPNRAGPVRESPLPAAADALEKLVGRWLRPDGGYILEIRGFDGDGNLDTAYFNPRPIRVSQARAGGSPEDLRIFVELTDVGYPGATYELRYIAEQDVLAGSYYQPAVGQRFDVFFVRRE